MFGVITMNYFQTKKKRLLNQNYKVVFQNYSLYTLLTKNET